MFIGNRETPFSIEKTLKEVVVDLLEKHTIECFYVGNHGNFDSIVKNVLENLISDGWQIRYVIVLAYIAESKNLKNTLYPQEVAKSIPKYRIAKRNSWMLKECDFVISYVKRSGVSKELCKRAERKGKRVINLADFKS